jgi:hypothetical protein
MELTSSWKGFGGGTNPASWESGLAGWLGGKSTFTGSLAQPTMIKVIDKMKTSLDVLNFRFFIDENLIYLEQ